MEQSGSRRVLVLGTDGRRRYQPVRKYIALAPGAYTLDYSMQGERETPAALGIGVYCAGSSRSARDQFLRSAADLRFCPARSAFYRHRACPVVLIAFEAKPTERPVEAQFANLSVNSGATDVPVDADETSDEEAN